MPFKITRANLYLVVPSFKVYLFEGEKRCTFVHLVNYHNKVFGGKKEAINISSEITYLTKLMKSCIGSC